MLKNNQLGEPNNVLTTDYVYDKIGYMIEQRQIADSVERIAKSVERNSHEKAQKAQNYFSRKGAKTQRNSNR